jgi:hypothetical protein
MSNSVRIWCEVCQEFVQLEIERLQTDALNSDQVWGDVVCPACHLVIATLTADAPGRYEVKRIDEESEEP